MTDVLLVEDDARLGQLLVTLLQRSSYEVRLAPTLARAREALDEAPPDLIVLDLTLPDGDGLDWLPDLRGRWRGPVLVLTARGDTSDEVRGLELGADDYLRKPVDPLRLVARVRALLRRRDPDRASCAVGALRVDAAQRAASMRGVPLVLTSAEFDLLWYLARRAGEVVSREQLYRALRGGPWDGIDRTIDLRVSALRRQLGDDARAWLKTVRGVGYVLAAP